MGGSTWSGFADTSGLEVITSRRIGLGGTGLDIRGTSLGLDAGLGSRGTGLLAKIYRATWGCDCVHWKARMGEEEIRNCIPAFKLLNVTSSNGRRWELVPDEQDEFGPRSDH